MAFVTNKNINFFVGNNFNELMRGFHLEPDSHNAVTTGNDK